MRLVLAHWWVELGLAPLVGRARCRCMCRDGCGLRIPLGNLSAMVGALSPLSFLFSLSSPSTGAYRLLD